MEDRVSSNQLLNPRKPVIWLLAVAAGAALFASGALVTRATMDDDDAAPGAADARNVLESELATR